MTDNIAHFPVRIPDPPCDTEPGEIETGLRVPMLRAEDSTWLGRWLGRIRRKPEPTTFHRALAIHIYHSEPRSALK